MRTFAERLHASAERAGSWLCVGIDPDPESFPADLGPEATLEWCLALVEATADVACAVKPNAAFFEALGPMGYDALVQLVTRVPPGLPVILDAKRADIGHSAAKYAEAAFDELGADAVTVNPYLGRDGVEPFAVYDDRGLFCLARTSNPSADDLQGLVCDGAPLWHHVVGRCMEWNETWGNVGMVVGATRGDDLATARAIAGDGIPFLVPGVGAQGADAADTMARAGDAHGAFALVNVGRGIAATKDAAWRDEMATKARRFAASMPFRKL